MSSQGPGGPEARPHDITAAAIWARTKQSVRSPLVTPTAGNVFVAAFRSRSGVEDVEYLITRHAGEDFETLRPPSWTEAANEPPVALKNDAEQVPAEAAAGAIDKTATTRVNTIPLRMDLDPSGDFDQASRSLIIGEDLRSSQREWEALRKRPSYPGDLRATARENEMPPKLKRKLAIGGAVVAAAGLTGGAYAASSGGTNPRQAFINDVAKRLNVSPTALNDALKGAYQDQLSQAVKSGKLTQAQANKIQQRIAKRQLAPIGFAHRGFFGRGPGGRGFGAGIRARGLDAAAKYLGLTDAQLLTQLRSGKSLAQIATAQNKSVSGLTSTLKADIKTRLDKAVAAKNLTSAQEQKILSRLDQRLNTLVNRKGLGHGMMHGGFRRGGMLPPGAPGP